MNIFYFYTYKNILFANCAIIYRSLYIHIYNECAYVSIVIKNLQMTNNKQLYIFIHY